MPISTNLHIAMLGFVVLICALTQYAGLKAKRRGTLRRANVFLGVGMLAFCLAYNVYYLHPSVFRWNTSLPLHACDIIAVVAAIVMFYPNHLARTVLFFSAIPLTTQALITPAGNQDPLTMRFWLYWVLHSGIVALSLFDVIANRYKPRRGDLLRVFLVDLVYVAFALALNIATGWNYGYVGDSKPAEATILDHLGPWPWRVAVIVGIAWLLQSIMLLVSLAVRRFCRNRRSLVSGGK